MYELSHLNWPGCVSQEKTRREQHGREKEEWAVFTADWYRRQE